MSPACVDPGVTAAGLSCLSPVIPPPPSCAPLLGGHYPASYLLWALRLPRGGLRRLTPADLPTSRARPSEHSAPKHPRRPVPPTQPLDGTGLLGFAFPTQAHRAIGPKRVRHPADYSFASRCSPPPLARTQFLSTSGRSVIAREGLPPSRPGTLVGARRGREGRLPGLPTLRTVRAVLPHTALRSVVLPH